MPNPFPQPNYPSPVMDTMMGAGEFSGGEEITANSDQEETAIAYCEAAVAMFKNAAESMPMLAPGVRQIAMFVNHVLKQALQGANQGPSMPPQIPMGEESAGPAGPTVPPSVS